MRAIVLAAGQGKRLGSESANLPKVMRLANGKPLLEWVLGNISFIPAEDITLVVGFMREKVTETFGDKYKYAVQDAQLGTGHAVMCAKDSIAGYDGPVLVAYGDMPLIQESSYRALIETHIAQGNDCTILTCVTDKRLAYGRIIRKGGEVVGIVEDRDCNPEQKLIKELNSGIYVFNSVKLLDALKKIKKNNDQEEYYLTDAPLYMQKLGAYVINEDYQIIGVNTIIDLEEVEKLLKNEDN